MAVLSDVRPTKLFLGGISQNTTTKDLRTHFSQFGRVLDCVAMRREDGRSRSFGYVTLDSLEAAKKCIAAAQTVDGRVIDVKLAVPERASKDKTSPSTPSKGSKRKSAKENTDVNLTDYSTLIMDADVKTTGPSESGSDSGDGFEGEEVLARLPLAQEEDFKQQLLSIGAPPGLSLPLTGLPTRPPPPGFAPPPPPSAVAALLSKTKLDDTFDETSTVAPSSNASPETVFVSCADESEDDESEEQTLPSLGAALHAAGQCRPCNFFGKGRCENGKACEFCHMPHQKRKPTRQEKRDRKLAWLERQSQKPINGAADASTVIDDGSLSEDIDFEPLTEAAPAPAVALYTPQHLAMQACMINFDDYSDFSDDDDEEPVKQWSREEMLQVKVALASA